MSEEPKIPAKRGRKPKSIEPAGVIDRMDDDTDPAPASGIPPCPKGNPDQGMKSPEVVEWWFTYHPEQAVAKYGGLTYPEAPI